MPAEWSGMVELHADTTHCSMYLSLCVLTDKWAVCAASRRPTAVQMALALPSPRPRTMYLSMQLVLTMLQWLMELTNHHRLQFHRKNVSVYSQQLSCQVCGT